MGEALRILHVEDNPLDGELVREQLDAEGIPHLIERVETEEAYLEALKRDPWDVILSDYRLPSFDGMTALDAAREHVPNVPFIFVSGTMGEEMAVEGLRRGASDYIVKNRIGRLAPALNRAMRECAERRSRAEAEASVRQMQQQIRALIETDLIGIMLTGLDGRVMQANDAFLRLVGYTREELEAGEISWKKLTPPEWEAVTQRVTNELIEHGVSARHEKEYIRRDGTRIPVLIGAARVGSSENDCTAFVLDMTEQKRAEVQIQRHLERLNSLRRIDLAITGSMDLRVTLNVLLDEVRRQQGVDAASVLLFRQHTQSLEFTAGSGFRKTTIRPNRIPLGEGYAGSAALTRQMVAVQDIRRGGQNATMSHLLRDESFISYAALPLVAKGKLKGVLEVFHRSELEFDADWIEFFHAIAGQAAIAVDDAEMFQNLEHSNHRLTSAYEKTLEGWVYALDIRDKETEGHSKRVTEMTTRMAETMGFTDEELVHIRRGALLHDIGKLGIPDSVLLKPGKLSDEDWVIMKLHTIYAFEWLSPISFLRPALDIPYCHHEKWDGSGYPRGLKGEAIPLSARIFAVIDVWDALSSDRPYRPAWDRERILEHIQGESERHFDPAAIEAFLKMRPWE